MMHPVMCQQWWLDLSAPQREDKARFVQVCIVGNTIIPLLMNLVYQQFSSKSKFHSLTVSAGFVSLLCISLYCW